MKLRIFETVKTATSFAIQAVKRLEKNSLALKVVFESQNDESHHFSEQSHDTNQDYELNSSC